VEAPPNVYRLDIVNGNLTISTVDNFNTANISVVGTMNYDQAFAATDRRTSPVSIPGVNDVSWSSLSSDGTRTNLDLINFAALPLSYVQLATVYRELPARDSSGYSHQFITSAISNSWTASSAMPRTGTGVYNGLAYGIVIFSPPGETFRTTSAFQMTANFLAGTVSGNISNFNFYNFDTGASATAPASAAGFAITFDGSITANNPYFSGQAKIPGVIAGRVEGEFAGPTAQEVGGSYHAESSDVTISGAFAGKK